MSAPLANNTATMSVPSVPAGAAAASASTATAAHSPSVCAAPTAAAAAGCEGLTATVLATRSLFVPASVPRVSTPFLLGPSDWIIPVAMSIQLLYFYRLPSEWGTQPDKRAASDFLPADRLADALERLLAHYPFLGGQLVPDARGSLEVHGMDRPLPFVTAECATARLDQLPLAAEQYHSSRSLPASLALLPDFSYAEPTSNPLLQAQHTRFACGGVCIGLRLHHAVVDGAAFFRFVAHWSELYRSGGSALSAPPLNDRQWLTPSEEEIVRRLRSHKEVAYEVVAASKPALSLYNAAGPCIARMFRFTADELTSLKKEASGSEGQWVSTYEALTAHLHRRVRAADALRCPDNWRSRLRNPSVPDSYSGNASLCTMVLVDDPTVLLREPLSVTAARMHSALAAADGDYFRGVMSWIASQRERQRITYQFDVRADLSCTAWNKFGIYAAATFETNCRPIRALLPHFQGMDGIAVFFSMEEEGSGSKEGEAAVDVLLGLEEAAMVRLEADPLFRAFRA